MNTSFNRLQLVNTYGAFGSVGRERHEIVFEGTRDEIVGPDTRVARVRVPLQAGRPDAAALLDEPLPLPARLADLVRGHGRRRASTPGPSTWSGSCWRGIPARWGCSRTIPSPALRRATCASTSTATGWRPCARTSPGSAPACTSGFPRCPGPTRTCANSSAGAAGWTDERLTGCLIGKEDVLTLGCANRQAHLQASSEMPREVCEQLHLQEGDEIELEPRVIDGETVWILRPKTVDCPGLVPSVSRRTPHTTWTTYARPS